MKAPKEEEIWRQVPPEEKIELMSRAHSNGILVAFIAILVASTLAVGFKFSALMWAALIGSPFVFQLAAGTAWKRLRPKVMLEYLAARSVARRYAFGLNSRELDPNLVFRGRLEEQFTEEQLEEALEASIENLNDASVWVALFSDAVVVMSEAPGGAELRMAHKLDSELKVEGRSLDNKGDYSNTREVWLSYQDRKAERRFKITSKYPAALIVFEKKLLAYQNEEIKRIQERINALTAPEVVETEEMDNLLF